ncbi:MAG: lysophospholipase [Micrococcales bacterium]|nr:MAG: lysophospholipase [Micrococcales bacterium]PIE28163.1 MAG: lysophospholipase [Micrococcales bacterium]
MTMQRFVAIGDSMAEGLMDGSGKQGFRGWMDRLAETLAAEYPGLTYANLGVRGKKSGEVLDEQVGPAIAMRPDLIAVSAGVNDLIHPGFDVATTVRNLTCIVDRLTGCGATVIMLGCPHFDRLNPWVLPLAGRFRGFNRTIADLQQQYGVLVLDLNHEPTAFRRGFWAPDRLHASSLGHEIIAARAARMLDLSVGEPAPPPADGRPGVVEEARWLTGILLPWLRGWRSAGPSPRKPKRSCLTPVVPAAPRPSASVDNRSEASR